MRSILTTLMYTLLLIAGLPMVFSASDKKDDKKDKDKKKGHQPVVIITYEPAWSPVTREFPLYSELPEVNSEDM